MADDIISITVYYSDGCNVSFPANSSDSFPHFVGQHHIDTNAGSGSVIHTGALADSLVKFINKRQPDTQYQLKWEGINDALYNAQRAIDQVRHLTIGTAIGEHGSKPCTHGWRWSSANRLWRCIHCGVTAVSIT